MGKKKLKCVKKLNKIITKTFAPFGISKVKLANDYCYYPYSAKIEYRLVDETLGDELFNLFCKETFGHIVTNNFMISLLHELGHHITLAEIYENEQIEKYCLDEKERIEKEMEKAKTDEEIKKLQFEYFNLPDEYAATKWAVDYAETHEVELIKKWKKIQKAILKFYIKNGVIKKEDLK